MLTRESPVQSALATGRSILAPGARSAHSESSLSRPRLRRSASIRRLWRRGAASAERYYLHPNHVDTDDSSRGWRYARKLRKRPITAKQKVVDDAFIISLRQRVEGFKQRAEIPPISDKP